MESAVRYRYVNITKMYTRAGCSVRVERDAMAHGSMGAKVLRDLRFVARLDLVT